MRVPHKIRFHIICLYKREGKGENQMTDIKYTRHSARRLPEVLGEVLSAPLLYELEGVLLRLGNIDELRLRADRRASVSMGDRNLLLEYRVGARELSEIFSRVCDGSLYAHAASISEGYITLSGGVRVGVVGRAVYDGARAVGVYDITGLCFRLPHPLMNVGDCVCRLLHKGVGGVLLYAPPGQGKTTLLRSVSAKMAGGDMPWRVCVIDSREELSPSLGGEGLLIDTLLGYRRSLGIEIAVRCMNAQLIVCDELGGNDEAEAILSVSGCGVPLLASAHASSVPELMTRTGIARLCEARVFGVYVGIRRPKGTGEYEYSITYAN